jgi:outer membrane lipoprotein carrier protein
MIPKPERAAARPVDCHNRRRKRRNDRRFLRPLVPFCGLLLVAGWAGLSALAAPAQSAQPVSLAAVNGALASAKTVFTHFVQERHLSLLTEPLRSEGYLCFEQPERIRWEVTSPYKSILVSDGSGVAQFEWVDEKWQKLELGLAAAMQQVVAQIAGVMKGQYTHNSREYSVALSNPPAGPVITLTPRNERMRRMIQAIEVHLAPDLKATRQVVLRENNGDYTDIRFDHQVVNLKFDGQTFDQAAPLGVERIRQMAEAMGNR